MSRLTNVQIFKKVAESGSPLRQMIFADIIRKGLVHISEATPEQIAKAQEACPLISMTEWQKEAQAMLAEWDKLYAN